MYTAEKGKDDRQLRVTSCRYADRQTDRQMVKLPRQEMDGRQRSGAETERMQQRQRGFVTVPTTTAAAAAAAAAKHLAFGDSRNLRRPPLQGEDGRTDGRADTARQTDAAKPSAQIRRPRAGPVHLASVSPSSILIFSPFCALSALSVAGYGGSRYTNASTVARHRLFRGVAFNYRELALFGRRPIERCFTPVAFGSLVCCSKLASTGDRTEIKEDNLMRT